MRTLATALFLTVSTLSAADPSLVNLVMPDAKVLAGMDVERAKTSPFGQYVLATFAQEGGKLARHVGAVFERDALGPIQEDSQRSAVELHMHQLAPRVRGDSGELGLKIRIDRGLVHRG